MEAPHTKNTRSTRPDVVEHSPLRFVAALLAAGALLAPDLDAEIVRLNDDLLPSDRSETTDAQLTPDGTQIVYLADDLIDEVPELFRVPVGGGSAPVKLNAPVDPKRILEFQITPDGSRVVYLVDPGGSGLNQFELYSVPMDGSAVAAQLGERHTSRWAISPDSTRVLYTADPDDDTVQNLFSVPVTGGSPVAIHGPLDATGPFSIDAATARVVSVTRVDGSAQFELYSAPQDGSAAPVKLSTSSSSGARDVRSYSGYAFFLATRGLFRVPADGSGAPVELSDTASVPGDVEDFAVSPDLSRVVYRADQDTTDVFELYGVPADGSSTPVKLNGTLTAGGDVDEYYAISPDGTRAIYRADQDTDGTEELYSSPIAGGTNVKLNDTITGSGSVRAEYVVTDGTDVVVYAAAQTLAADRELFSVPIDGSAGPLKIAPADGGSGDVWRIFDATADGTQVFFAADHTTLHRIDLYVVPVDDSADPTRLSQVTVEFGQIESLVLTPDDVTAAYRADQDARDAVKVYSVPVDGSATPVRLNGDAVLEPGGTVVETVPSPDGTQVVYTAIQETPDARDLYRVAVDRSQPPVRLDDGFLPGHGASSVSISSDSAWVVYLADATVDGEDELFSIPLDGSLPAAKLSGPGIVDVTRYLLVPGDDTVLYLAEGRVYAVPIDGSQPPLEVSGVMQPTGAVSYFTVSPDGTRVVYVADQITENRFELFSGPIDASTSPIRISQAGYNVYGGAQVDPTGAWVVYRTPLQTSHPRLFRTSIDGSSSPVELNPGAVGDTKQFEITPDGTRVVYLAEQDTTARVEVFSVPLLGPGDTIQLNLEAGISADVEDFELSPDGQWVVFRVDQYRLNVLELFTAPVDGSRRAFMLNDPLNREVFVELVDDYAITSDSRRVVFGVRSIVGEPTELYSAPVHGRRKATRLNPPPVEGSNVLYFSLGLDGCRVTYVADQDIAGVRELYSVPVVGGAAVKLHPPLDGLQDVGAVVHVPGSQRLLFQADLVTPYITELYSTTLPVQLGTITPASGPFAGGNTVTLRGCFTPATTVHFGGVPATSVTWIDDGKLRVVVPAQPAPTVDLGQVSAERRGLTVDVTVHGAEGDSTLTDGYRYGRERTRQEVP